MENLKQVEGNLKKCGIIYMRIREDKRWEDWINENYGFKQRGENKYFGYFKISPQLDTLLKIKLTATNLRKQ